jgi:hypothetical protein
MAIDTKNPHHRSDEGLEALTESHPKIAQGILLRERD